MRHICAWCGEETEESEDDGSDQISHGICQKCAKKLKGGEFEEVDFHHPGLDDSGGTR